MRWAPEGAQLPSWAVLQNLIFVLNCACITTAATIYKHVTVISLYADEAKPTHTWLLSVAVYFDQLRKGFQAGRDRVDSARSSWWLRVHECRRL